MDLFDGTKVGMFLDSIVHATENRKGDQTKIVVLSMRLQPFDHKLAILLDQAVRNTLFKLNHPDPWPHIRRADFGLGVPRQNLTIFASSDTETSSIAVLQAKISGVYVRTQKDVDGFALVLKASFGPVDAHELAYVEEWRNGQRWVRFEESEPGLFDGEDTDLEASDDAPETRNAPMWTDDEAETQRPAAAAEDADAARTVPRRGRKPRTKADPETERQAQRADGAKRSKRNKVAKAAAAGVVETTDPAAPTTH